MEGPERARTASRGDARAERKGSERTGRAPPGVGTRGDDASSRRASSGTARRARVEPPADIPAKRSAGDTPELPNPSRDRARAAALTPPPGRVPSPRMTHAAQVLREAKALMRELSPRNDGDGDVRPRTSRFLQTNADDADALDVANTGGRWRSPRAPAEASSRARARASRPRRRMSGRSRAPPRNLPGARLRRHRRRRAAARALRGGRLRRLEARRAHGRAQGCLRGGRGGGGGRARVAPPRAARRASRAARRGARGEGNEQTRATAIGGGDLDRGGREERRGENNRRAFVERLLGGREELGEARGRERRAGKGGEGNRRGGARARGGGAAARRRRGGARRGARRGGGGSRAETGARRGEGG